MRKVIRSLSIVIAAAILLLTAILVAAYTAQITQPSNNGVNISQNFGDGVVGTNFTFSFRDADLGAVADAVSVNITQNGATVFTTTLAGANQDTFTFSFNTSSLADGRYNISINMTDTEAGDNQTNASFNFTIDNTKPGVTFNAPVNNSVQANTSLNVYYTVNDGLSTAFNCSLQINGALANAATALVSVATNISGTVAQAVNRSYFVACTDAANNTNSSYTRVVTIDTTNPVAGITGRNTSGGNVTNFAVTGVPDYLVLINVTDNFASTLNRTVLLLVSGALTVINNTSVDNGTSTLMNVTLTEGNNTIRVFVNDTAFNMANTTFIVTADFTAPNVAMLFPNASQNLSTTYANITWNATDALDSVLSCNVTLDSSVVATNRPSANATPTNYTVTSLAEGNHSINVTCSDEPGNATTSSTVLFTVDTVKPVVNISSPANRTATSNTTPAITFNATDAVTNLSYAVLVDGVQDTSGVTGNNTLTTVTLSALTQGNHTVLVQMNDSAGNSGNASIVLTVDTAAPGISIIFPTLFLNRSVADINVTFNMTDNLAANVSCNVTLDNVNNGTVQAFNATPANLSIYDLVQGMHAVNVSCVDAAGNRNTTAAVNFTIDTTTPFVNITSPANRTVTSNTTPAMSFYGTDSVASMNYAVLVDGTEAFNGTAVNATVVNITLDTLTQGNHTVLVRMNDSAGNSGNASILITVDTAAPGVVVNSPSAFLNRSATDINVSFTATDNLAANMSCNVTVFISPGATQPDGNNNTQSINNSMTNISINLSNSISDSTRNWTVNVTCADAAGNSNTSASVRFFLDSITPLVNITSPVNKTVVSNATPAITFNGTDGVASMNYAVLVDGALDKNGTAANNTATTITLSALTQGNHTVLVRMNDSANNTGLASVLITVDTAAPAVSVVVPTAAQNISVNYTNVTWNATDNLDAFLNCTATLDSATLASNVSSPNNTFTNYTAAGLAVGSHSVNVTCSDDAGNTTTSSTIAFIIDTSTPTVNITRPTNRSFTNNATPIVTFFGTDNVVNLSYAVLVDGTLDASGVVGNNSPVNVTLSALTQGNRTITVRLNDSANNTGSAAIIITVDTAVPRVNIAAPSSGSTVNIPSAPSSVAINYTSLDNLGPSANCSIYVNGTLNASNTIVTNGSTSNASISFGTGQFNVTIVCSDNATNTGRNQTLFTVTTAPTINISSPSNGSASQTSNGTATFIVTSGVGGTVSWRFIINGSQNFTGVGASGATVTINFSQLAAGTLGNGTYTLTAEGNDSGGAPVNQSVTFIIDTVAPVISSFSVSPTTVDVDETVSGACSATDAHSSVSTSITGISTSTAGSKTATCTATDAAGNTVSSSASYTVNAASRDTNGAGGSGGGSSTFTGGGGSATFDLDSVSAGSLVLDVEAVNNPIDTINVALEGAGSNVHVVVARLTIAPPAAGTPPSPAYAYLSIQHTNLPNVDYADVTFSVPATWFDENGLESNQIALFRWEENHWQEYVAEVVSTLGGNVNYRTRLPGLSYLTIAKKSDPVATAPKTAPTSTNASAAPTTTTPPAEAPPASKTPSAVAPETGQENKAVVIVVSVAAAIFVAGTVLYLFFSGRPPRHHAKGHAKGGHKRGELHVGSEE